MPNNSGDRFLAQFRRAFNFVYNFIKVGVYGVDAGSENVLKVNSSGELDVNVVSTVGSGGTSGGTIEVTTALSATAYDLIASGDYTATSVLTGDFVLDNVEFNFTTTASKDITISTSEGTTIFEVIGSSAMSVDLSAIARAFDAGESFTVAVSNAAGASVMTMRARVRQSVTSSASFEVDYAIYFEGTSAHDLATDFDEVSTLAEDFILDNVIFTFSNTSSRDIRVETSVGTTIFELIGDTSTSLILTNLDRGFSSGENIRIVVDNGTAGCDVEVAARTLTGLPKGGLTNVVNAIQFLSWDLTTGFGNGALSATSSISVPYSLDNISLNFSNATSRDITITSPIGAVLYEKLADTSAHVDLADMSIAFKAGEDFILDVTDTGATNCLLDITARVRQE